MVHEEFQELATELIGEDGDSCTYRSFKAGIVSDPDAPWEGSAADTFVDYPLKVVFVQDDLEDRQFKHFLNNTNVMIGQVDAYVSCVDLPVEPTPNDMLQRPSTNETHIIKAIDKVQPGPDPILWIFEFHK